jgi:signal transduction histidine kinase
MAELAHVNRFSTAGELTASIAHEINQPLGSILTNAETAQAILKSPSPDIVELNEIVGDILRDDRRASEVIRRILRELKIATPSEPIQLTIYWKAPTANARHVREHLRELCQQVPQIPICLRSSSAHPYSVTLSFNSSQQLDEFQNLVYRSEYWSQTMP